MNVPISKNRTREKDCDDRAESLDFVAWSDISISDCYHGYSDKIICFHILDEPVSFVNVGLVKPILFWVLPREVYPKVSEEMCNK